VLLEVSKVSLQAEDRSATASDRTAASDPAYEKATSGAWMPQSTPSSQPVSCARARRTSAWPGA
jgi:hypothetical protein